MVLHHHTVVKGEHVDKRKLVIMSDKITLDSLHAWVEVSSLSVKSSV